MCLDEKNKLVNCPKCGLMVREQDISTCVRTDCYQKFCPNCGYIISCSGYCHDQHRYENQQ